jgi:hypothetical protein
MLRPIKLDVVSQRSEFVLVSPKDPDSVVFGQSRL